MDQDRHGEFYCKGFFDPSPQTWTPPATPGPGWERPQREQPFDLPWPDEELRDAYLRSRGAFVQPRGEGFALAYPLDCRSPFPLPGLFCFARAQCLGGRGWWVFSFDPHGLPSFEGV